jgi:hypothetical protein
MKSILKAIGVGTVIFAFSSVAYAAPALVQIGVGSCTMADGSGNFLTITSPELKIKVSTQSANGNLILNCHADNIPNITGKAVKYGPADGQCIINDPLRGPRVADVWHQTLSASGQSDLMCQTNTP